MSNGALSNVFEGLDRRLFSEFRLEMGAVNIVLRSGSLKKSKTRMK